MPNNDFVSNLTLYLVYNDHEFSFLIQTNDCTCR